MDLIRNSDRTFRPGGTLPITFSHFRLSLSSLLIFQRLQLRKWLTFTLLHPSLPPQASDQTPSPSTSWVHFSLYTLIVIVRAPPSPPSASSAMATASQLLSLFLLVFCPFPIHSPCSSKDDSPRHQPECILHPLKALQWVPPWRFSVLSKTRHRVAPPPLGRYHLSSTSPLLRLSHADLHSVPQMDQDPADSRPSCMLSFLFGTT